MNTDNINRKLKHINIDTNNNNYENSNVVKKVSWEDNNSNNISLIIDDYPNIDNNSNNSNSNNSNNSNNIFNKLKKINVAEETIPRNKDIIKLSQQIEILNTKFDTLIDKMTAIIENQQQNQNK